MGEELHLGNSVPGISVHGASDEENDAEVSQINANDDEHFSDLSSGSEDGEDKFEDGEDKFKSSSSSVEKENNDENVVKDLENMKLDDSVDQPKLPYEVVGDRILIERDGKFELIDASDVKAEYFQMMGVTPETTHEEKPGSDNKITENGSKTELDATGKKSPRPKTSPMKTSPNRTAQNNRATSAHVRQRENDEYAHIKSRYAMTEHQLEMKRRREELVAKRKREEEEREKEEMERKRSEAESAFQAWLRAKNEEAEERRRSMKKGNDEGKEERIKAAEDAYQLWLTEKSKQKKQEKHVDRIRLEDEASSYVIRERQACEEAFNRWLKEKRAEEKRKHPPKKPKKKKKKRRPKEQPPVSSSSFRFTDYNGYRNTVAL